AEAPQTAVDFPKEDQQQQQQEQQERQNSQSDSQGLFNKFRSASGSSTFTAVASHPAVDDSAASLTNFYYKSGGELDRFLDSLSALDHCPTVASLPDCLSSSPSKASSRLIAAVEANSLGDLIRLLHSPASSAAGACDLNWADEARNGETALTAALRQGNVAAVRLLLQHGCAVNAWCQLPAASALSASSSGDAAGNDRQQQQFKDPIVVASVTATPVSQALATAPNQLSVAQLGCSPQSAVCHILPRPGLSVQFDIADRLPSLALRTVARATPCSTPEPKLTAAPLVRLRGRCSVREVWLNNVRPDAAESGRLFHLQPAPRSVSAPTLSAWCQRVVSAASRRQIPAIG
uniref:ANK_REP_REGION domain-containing protein n=1 Tax=Macrostomum lignano TaxID=282301 RepID=A0A1I8HJV2_9PLAT